MLSLKKNEQLDQFQQNQIFSHLHGALTIMYYSQLLSKLTVAHLSKYLGKQLQLALNIDQWEGVYAPTEIISVEHMSVYE